jgi:hypothetical protein
MKKRFIVTYIWITPSNVRMPEHLSQEIEEVELENFSTKEEYLKMLHNLKKNIPYRCKKDGIDSCNADNNLAIFLTPLG